MATAAGDELEKILPSVDNAPLDSEFTLFDVKNALIPVMAEWRAVGEGLRLTGGTLNVIEKNHPNDAKSCMGAVAREWLNRSYSTETFGEPTWRKLVEIIGNPMGGNNLNHARKIAKQHPDSNVRNPPLTRSDSRIKEVAALQEHIRELERKMEESARSHSKQQLVSESQPPHQQPRPPKPMWPNPQKSSGEQKPAVSNKSESQPTPQQSGSLQPMEPKPQKSTGVLKLSIPKRSVSQPTPQQPESLQPMQPKPQKSTGEQKLSILTKSWWQSLLGPMQLKQGAPLPDWFNQLNDRIAHLSSIKITDVQAEAVAENLRINMTVEKLELINVSMSDVGFSTFAAALRENQSLTTLKLYHVNISDVGFSTFTDAIRHNQNLTFLDLLGTNMSDSKANTLAIALRENKTLQVLGVDFKSVSDRGARDFAKKMEGWKSSLNNLVIYNSSEGVRKLLATAASKKGIDLRLY